MSSFNPLGGKQACFKSGAFPVSSTSTGNVAPESGHFALSGGVGYLFTNGIQLQAGEDQGFPSLNSGKSNIDHCNRAVKFSPRSPFYKTHRGFSTCTSTKCKKLAKNKTACGKSRRLLLLLIKST